MTEASFTSAQAVAGHGAGSVARNSAVSTSMLRRACRPLGPETHMTPRAARGRLIFRERPTVAAVTTLTALSVGEAALKVSRRLVVVALTFQLAETDDEELLPITAAPPRCGAETHSPSSASGAAGHGGGLVVRHHVYHGVLGLRDLRPSLEDLARSSHGCTYVWTYSRP